MVEPGADQGEARVRGRAIHLLYVPTLCCNLGCAYCYLGEQTSQAALKEDAGRAVATLRHALQALDEAGVLAFNVSLHGGEVTTLPPAVLDELFRLIRAHYLRHYDALHALGHVKAAPHIKTNLYRFAPLLELFKAHKVSISASIDLPLRLHERYRVTRGGRGWLARTHENLRLLAAYPYAKKISATLCAEHLDDIPAIIDDIWFIHREIGFDMNQFNIMFAFASELNRRSKGAQAFTPVTAERQRALYDALKAAFVGTELEDGLRRHWFDEFKPSYCTHARNCGERFYLLQSDGSVYSCVRGQGLEEFRYGNILTDPLEHILANGARKIAAAHARQGFDPACRRCGHLSICHTGCPVVKHQSGRGRSYTCDLQRAIYADQPLSYPADEAAVQQLRARDYALRMHPATSLALAEPAAPTDGVLLGSELAEARNALPALIAADPVLRELYSDTAFVLELNGELHPLGSQLLKSRARWHTLLAGDRVVIHVRRQLFEVHCEEPVRNTLYLQMLRDTPVVYGDEQRTKQEHLFSHQLFFNCLMPSAACGDAYLMADLTGLIALHRPLYQRGVRNNLFFTTLHLREYHYQKQKNNAFYHIQALNLPFQNFEFHFLPPAGDSP
ncbi:MAG: radical SAM protein [Sterolibacterium sp.]|jgi:uncharacterized protein|nr:radical SAM protein [Sterolibacterium sp.]